MKVLIVGGVAGGASAAARLRRLQEHAEIILIERGEYISFANCGLPYHISGVIADEDDLLLQTPESFQKRFAIEVRTGTEAVGVDAANKRLNLKDLATGREYSESYDALILAPGAEPIRPPLPGLNHPKVYTLRNIPDMKRIMEVARDGAKHVVVIGGGYIGIEVADNLRERGLEVDIVELADHIVGPLDTEMANLLTPVLNANGVGLRLGDGIAAVKETDGGITVVLASGAEIPCDFAVMGIGVRPETTLAKSAGCTIGATGAIQVDDHMRTSVADIYAVGDAVEVRDFISHEVARIPLAGPANRQGRIAADVISGRDSAYRDTIGAAVLKVFDHTVAMVSNNERQLMARGASYDKVYTHSGSHAGYYPGARPISLKLLFEVPSGKILGAQAIGIEGVDKRIDVLATAMRAGMTVYDLEHLELSYAPPYSSAKDPINVAGFVAANILRGDMPPVHWHDIASRDRAKVLLLDVRTPAEYAAGTVGDAINIPLDDLRRRLGELPRDKEIWVNCQVGLRGYLAVRTLLQNGYHARNLVGGYKTWRTATAPAPSSPSRLAPLPCGADNDETNDRGELKKVGDPRPFDELQVVDARGLQCPGPIMSTFQALEGLKDGQGVRILATDPGFAADIGAWCRRTGNTLVSNEFKSGSYVCVIRKGVEGEPQQVKAGFCSNDKTMVVFSGDLDKALASFIIANGAAAMGRKVTMFFTFWGLNILRKPQKIKTPKDFFATMFGAMMPRGTGKLGLSKMNMLGMGPAMIRMIMTRKNVSTLDDLIAQALRNGVKLIACSMSMDIMGLKAEEFIDGVEIAGVASYLAAAEEADTNLFI